MRNELATEALSSSDTRQTLFLLFVFIALFLS